MIGHNLTVLVTVGVVKYHAILSFAFFQAFAFDYILKRPQQLRKEKFEARYTRKSGRKVFLYKSVAINLLKYYGSSLV